MPVQISDYDERLAAFSSSVAVLELLKHHRPYLELLPSMRRPVESLIAIPLPIVRAIASGVSGSTHGYYPDSTDWDRTASPALRRQTVRLPCDVAVLMCDPEWQVKTGVELYLFIHRPDETFYELLSRWRQTQVLLDRDYEWVMPLHYQHILGDNADRLHPLFVVFPDSPPRILKGLQGSHLPYAIYSGDAGSLDRPSDGEEVEDGDFNDTLQSEAIAQNNASLFSEEVSNFSDSNLE